MPERIINGERWLRRSILVISESERNVWRRNTIRRRPNTSVSKSFTGKITFQQVRSRKPRRSIFRRRPLTRQPWMSWTIPDWSLLSTGMWERCISRSFKMWKPLNLLFPLLISASWNWRPTWHRRSLSDEEMSGRLNWNLMPCPVRLIRRR